MVSITYEVYIDSFLNNINIYIYLLDLIKHGYIILILKKIVFPNQFFKNIQDNPILTTSLHIENNIFIIVIFD